MTARWAYLVAALLASIAMHAQTTVSGQVTDSDSIHWAGGQWTATYTNVGYDPPVVNGQPFTQSFSGALDANGSLSQVLTSTNLISPSVSAPKAGWVICVSPGISSPQTYCTKPLSITGSTFSATSAVNAVIVAPRPTCGAPVFAYADVEMSLPVLGCTYYNTTSSSMRLYTSGGWTNISGGGGGSTSPGGSGYSVQYNNAESFGGASFNGLGWFSTGAAPGAANSMQVQGVIGAGVYDASGAAAAAQTASLQKANNLSDLASAATARTNLGLGTAAVQPSTAFDAAGAAASAQAAAQAASDPAGSASTAQAASLQKANNLSDLASAATARTNLGLGTAAITAASAYDAAGAAATAQANAEAAFSGDVTKTAGNFATTVTKVNGGTVPVLAAALATNSNGQIIAVTVIANIQITLPTSSIAANTCTTAATATMTGLATTSTIATAFASSPVAVTGWGAMGGLVFEAWPTTNTLNWSICNQTASAITPGAMTLNAGAK